jgi:hypothetical protein
VLILTSKNGKLLRCGHDTNPATYFRITAYYQIITKFVHKKKNISSGSGNRYNEGRIFSPEESRNKCGVS